MKKHFIKCVIVVLLLILGLYISATRILESPPEYADDYLKEIVIVDLTDLATDFIEVTKSSNNHNESTTYSNLSSFIDAARKEYPELSDEELVHFIMQYTEQPYMKLSNTMLDNMLAFENITTSHFYGKRNAFGGNVSLENNSTSDADIEISIHYSQKESSESENHYVIWAYATLLKQPVIPTDDRLYLTNDAVFDSHYEECGNLLQIGYCKNCSQYITNSYEVTNEKRHNGNLLLEYARKDPNLHFEVSKTKCPDCSKTIENVSFTSCVQYRFITTEHVNVQLEYIRDNILKDKYSTSFIIYSEKN